MRFSIFFVLFSISFFATAQSTTEEKQLTTSTGNLKGTLIIPSNTKKLSLVIIQAGSGPTDRNGNSLPGLKANSYRLLAEALAQKHIATLLIDKRGIGESNSAMAKESDLLFDDYVTDLVGWASLLKKDRRIKKIFLTGHSEGSLIAMLAMQKSKPDGFISLAGAGEPINKIIVLQLAQQSPKLATVADSLFTRLGNRQKIDTVNPFLLSIFRPSVQPYIASWMAHDPCVEIKKVNKPILLIQGTTDIQVELKQAQLLKSCNTKATLKIMEGMNHILKMAPVDRGKNVETYSNANLPLMHGLADVIADFIKKN